MTILDAPPPSYDSISRLSRPPSSNHISRSTASRRSKSYLLSLPSHLLLQILSQIPFNSLFFHVRPTSRKLYIIAIHLLRTDFLPGYYYKVRPPYTSDPLRTRPGRVINDEAAILRNLESLQLHEGHGATTAAVASVGEKTASPSPSTSTPPSYHPQSISPTSETVSQSPILRPPRRETRALDLFISTCIFISRLTSESTLFNMVPSSSSTTYSSASSSSSSYWNITGSSTGSSFMDRDRGGQNGSSYNSSGGGRLGGSGDFEEPASISELFNSVQPKMRLEDLVIDYGSEGEHDYLLTGGQSSLRPVITTSSALAGSSSSSSDLYSTLNSSIRSVDITIRYTLRSITLLLPSPSTSFQTSSKLPHILPKTFIEIKRKDRFESLEIGAKKVVDCLRERVLKGEILRVERGGRVWYVGGSGR